MRRRDLDKRLRALEEKKLDPFAGVHIDFLNGLEDYPEDEWEVVFYDDTLTLLRCKNAVTDPFGQQRRTGELQGVYAFRIPLEELSPEARKWL